MKPLFAVLICHLPERQQLLDRVVGQLNEQRKGEDCIVLINRDNGEKTTGTKRNELLEQARSLNASHVAFVDDDDLIGPTYIQRSMEAVRGDFDTMELWGQYYENNIPGMPFHHSVIYDKWWQDKRAYYRCNNHLNLMKLELVKDIKFRDITIGEDGNWAMDIHKSGVLKSEYKVNEITYHYFSGGRKDHKKEIGLALRRGIKL